MKKLMFSAVALVTLSFAGMANNEKIESVEVLRNDPCIAFSFQVLDDLEALHGCEYSDVEAGQIILAAYDLCDN
ncbi:hypothetical protein KK2020170_06610 [Flavobacterium okayamense]|uniref:Uncharacterized protein n=2 Tax=Flavobacterium okayamense TaxID=2830782 RepID=A0ABN6HTA1_9FLAO|nr:hypothetical protein KK2020170_06610 [Flavobacterium okayamense]